jgi:serine/threonine protein kinase
VFERDRIDRDGRKEGTLPYMSPEQAAGERSNRDGRSDFWSLGVILYQLLTGHLPFQGSTPEKILLSIQEQTPVPPRTSRPEVPAELQRICLKCLRKHPDERYQAAADLQHDLQNWKQVVP